MNWHGVVVFLISMCIVVHIIAAMAVMSDRYKRDLDIPTKVRILRLYRRSLGTIVLLGVLLAGGVV